LARRKKRSKQDSNLYPHYGADNEERKSEISEREKNIGQG